MNPPDLLYVLHREAPSETFIRREIAALRGCGVPVRVHILDAPDSVPPAPPGLRRRLARALAARLLAPDVPALYAVRLLRRAPQALRLAAVAAALDRPRLHAQFAWSAADAAGLAAAALGAPWSCSVHAWDVFTRPDREIRARLATAVGVTACTDRAAAALLRAGVPAARVHVIRHGLDPADLPFQPLRPSGRLAASGRLVAKKGFDALLDACAALRAQGVPFACTLAGAGPERRRLERRARSGGIADAVDFVGWLAAEESQRVIGGATVLVHPSRRLANADADGFANVLSEAMFLGTPIVTTAAGAAAELLRDGVNARLVPSDDPAALAAALRELLASPGTCGRLAAAARKTAEEHLDQDRLIGRYRAFFAQDA